MSPLDPTLAEVLKAIDGAEKERSPASPDLIAEKCGLEVEEVKMRLAEATDKGLAYYFNGSEETTLPTASGWTLTAQHQVLLGENSAE